jgi:hypothetical protein
MTSLEERANHNDTSVRKLKPLLDYELRLLEKLPGKPDKASEEDSPFLKWVRQSGKYEVWRVSHPFVPGAALRLIVWFTPTGEAVVILFGNDKAQMGDVFYDSLGSRADQAIERFIAQRKAEENDRNSNPV